jgi:hypothetical protein
MRRITVTVEGKEKMEGYEANGLEFGELSPRRRNRDENYLCVRGIRGAKVQYMRKI